MMSVFGLLAVPSIGLSPEFSGFEKCTRFLLERS
jgi:hypothetical protein